MQYLVGQTFDFDKALWPEEAMQIPVKAFITLLERRYGSLAAKALDPEAAIPGPFATDISTDWLKTAKTVGINVRTIRHFWNIIPYSLLLPNAQNAIHILPIWETGVVSSLYGPSS